MSDVDRSAFFVSAQDSELIGSSAKRDPLGILPVWSSKGRALIPHLTEQTNWAEGFQLLLTIFWLWRYYVEQKPQHSGEVRAFYLVAEQAFARASVRIIGDWRLPGRRRVLARQGAPTATLSLRQRAAHLLDNQLANGTWGLYRGAASRAELLVPGASFLSRPVLERFDAYPPLMSREVKQLFRLLTHALDEPDDGVEMSLNRGSGLVNSLAAVVDEKPHAEFLWEHLVDAEPLTKKIVAQLLATGQGLEELGHLGFLEKAAAALPEGRDALENVIRCESFIAPLEAIFTWLCNQGGHTIESAAKAFPGDMVLLRSAQEEFRISGKYSAGGASERWKLYANDLDASSSTTLLTTLLRCHQQIAEQRGRAPWVENDEMGRLVTNVEVGSVSEEAMVPKLAWRNDYYLQAMTNVARGLDSAILAHERGRL